MGKNISVFALSIPLTVPITREAEAQQAPWELNHRDRSGHHEHWGDRVYRQLIPASYSGRGRANSLRYPKRRCEPR